MLNYRSEIVGDESVTSIDHYDEFYVILLFDRCAHIWVRSRADIITAYLSYIIINGRQVHNVHVNDK